MFISFIVHFINLLFLIVCFNFENSEKKYCKKEIKK